MAQGEIRVYPLATHDRKYIPFDIVRFDSSLFINISNSPMTNGLSLFDTDNGTLFQLSCNVDCLVGFAEDNTAITAPVNETENNYSIIIPANSSIFLYSEREYLSAIALSGSGILIVNKLEKWNALGLDNQFAEG